MENLKEYDVVYFSTTWCAPCKATKPIVEKASNENGINTRLFTVDEEDGGTDVAAEFGIRAVPTMVFFKNGEEVGRKTGATTEREFIELCNSYRN